MTTNPPSVGTTVLDDTELLEKAQNAENGRRFRLLYDQGWNSSVVRRVYDRPRHARLALVNHLLWWSRHDFTQVRRLFSRSALCPGDLTSYRDYFQDLVRAAKRLLGEECYDPEYAVDEGGEA